LLAAVRVTPEIDTPSGRFAWGRRRRSRARSFVNVLSGENEAVGPSRGARPHQRAAGMAPAGARFRRHAPILPGPS
jgi:hypothetical protein